MIQKIIMDIESIGLTFNEELLQWPQILFYLFIPIGLLTYAIKCALDHFRIFERSSIVQWGIGAIISILAVLFMPQDILGIPVAAASLFGIVIFKFWNWKGMILGIILVAVYWFIVPMLIDLLTF